MRFIDPDGYAGEVECLNRTFDAAHPREVVEELNDTRWLETLADLTRPGPVKVP